MTTEPIADIVEAAVEESTMRRKKDIVDHVANETGLKKRGVREALDSAFGYLRTSLDGGKEIAYPTLGKIKIIVQRADTDNPKVQYRLALAKPQASEDDAPLAEGDEEA